MRMIPASPYDRKSRAELRVFDALKRSFSSDSRQEYVAYHSLNLTRHARKRFGEIDFVICCPRGIYVLEIKGGGIACRQGVWYSTDARGVEHRLSESPFRQAETGLHGLIGKLKESLPHSIYSKFVFGYGVVFPDTDWSQTGAEWEQVMVSDSRAVKDMDRWLRGLFCYWESKPGVQPGRVDAGALREAGAFLRPEVEAIVPLHVQTGWAADQVVELTESQMEAVDYFSENDRVLCAGGAGTGKTLMALEFARRWSGAGKQVALVCKSPWLQSYLHAHFTIPNLEICLLEALGTRLRRKAISAFDALIVDEGQDMLQMGSLDLLDQILTGGLAKGSWTYFYDINNQSGFFGEVEPEALEFLKSCGPSIVQLKKNCRNTRLILEEVKSSLGADMGVQGAGEGPAVRKQTAKGREDSARALQAELELLIRDGGLSPAQITILSASDFAGSSVAVLPESLQRKVHFLDEYSLANFPPSELSFACVADFKGLENDAIVVVDLPEPKASSTENLAAHYVAMSRAKAVLSLIYRNDLKYTKPT